MALLIRGKTRCAICEQVIGDGDNAIGAPPFIADRSHPLWRFSDAAFHRNCYEQWEHRAAFEAEREKVMPGYFNRGSSSQNS
jgi:hypothetical protein